MSSDCGPKLVEQFAHIFRYPTYDGSYHGANGFRTPASEEACGSFFELTHGNVVWSQVHGDFKSVVARGLFQPYEHWPELYECCRKIIEGHAALNTVFEGDDTRAKIMGESMALLKAKYGYRVPRWWLPVMNKLRGKK